ncbi:MAG: 16S rRNA (cytidine(1402)-2'-O)-methyltransferase [Anaerolineae bacterium]|nr:16S rRNA (cytidine(1402)-2'-O)-methyltransferase [Anaerolineae bacterium]
MTTHTAKLYIVATPIGNMEDITLRAIRILKECDVIICEEFKPARRLLKRLEIPDKELLAINEHNEKAEADAVLYRMLQNNESAALISDCGTPVFSDPGATLIARAVEFGITVIPIPGVSSLMTTLSVLDFNPDSFLFGGFLSRDSAERQRELFRLKKANLPVVLMDTPYRLGAVLADAAKVFGKGRQATLACDLTTRQERILRSTLGELLTRMDGKKAEFMLVIHPYLG